MNNRQGEAGLRFGMLTSRKDVGQIDGRRVWEFECDCGTIVDRTFSSVKSVAKRGNIPNCGCHTINVRSESGKQNKTHGRSSHRLYDVWRQMHQRCYNPSCKDFLGYGGRGISICAEWHNVDAFIAWAENSGYRQGLTIERMDNDAGYYPDNCWWIENKFQAHNTRRLTEITYHGLTAHASFWSRRTGIRVTTIINRMRLGWDDEKIIETPVRGVS